MEKEDASNQAGIYWLGRFGPRQDNQQATKMRAHYKSKHALMKYNGYIQPIGIPGEAR